MAEAITQPPQMTVAGQAKNLAQTFSSRRMIKKSAQIHTLPGKANHLNLY